MHSEPSVCLDSTPDSPKPFVSAPSDSGNLGV